MLARPQSSDPQALNDALSQLIAAMEPGPPWTYVTAGNPGFTANVVNFDGGTPPFGRSVRYRRNALGMVELQGLIGFTGPCPLGSTLFTLPDGCRPFTDGTIAGAGTAHNLTFLPAAWTGAAYIAGAINIGTNGTVYSPAGGPSPAGAAGIGYWLDGIVFQAAPSTK